MLAPGVPSAACCEAQKRSLGQNLEVVRMEFKVRGGALVPVVT